MSRQSDLSFQHQLQGVRHAFELEGLPPYNFYLTMEKNFAIRRRAFYDLFDGESYLFGLGDPMCTVRVIFTGTPEEPAFSVILAAAELSNREEKIALDRVAMILGCNEDLGRFYGVAEMTELKSITERLRGLHMLQFNGLFTALVLGITLQNAPVKRSMDMFSFILEQYGRRIERDLYLPLRAQDLKRSTAEDLRRGKLGYRADYLLKLAENFDDGLERQIEGMSTKKAKGELMRFDGVGDYTAEFALFGSTHGKERRYDVFPIDSWSLGIYTNIFSIEKEKREKAKALCRKHAEEHFGDLMGLAFWYVMMSTF